MNLEHVFVTSGYGSNGYNNITELLNIQSETWRTGASYPYFSDVRGNLPFYYQQSFIVFGGNGVGGSRSSIIAQYNPASNSWKKLGDMVRPRSHHTGIRSLNSFYIYGGYASTVEVCTLTGDSIQCVEQDPPYRQVD